MPTLSVVIPVYNEEGNVTPLGDALRAALTPLAPDYELLFIDDGSRDRTLAEIERLHASDPRVKALSLSRNFGHQAALTAGLDVADGDAVIVMDGDLQHPPAVIAELVARWREGYDIVYTLRQEKTTRAPIKRLCSAVFYRVFRWLSGLDLPPNTADFRLLDRRVVAAFRQMRERVRFLRGLTNWVGYRAVAVPYTPQTRRSGQTKYTYSRMAHFALDAIVSFSVRPLYAAIWLGFGMALLGMVYLVYVFAAYWAHHIVRGWASILSTVLVIGGIQLIVLGVIGLYIGKIYEEVKRRPLYLVRRSLGVREPT